MKNKILAWIAVLLLFFLATVFSLSQEKKERERASLTSDQKLEPIQQTYPVNKPKYDYMSTFLSRNTKPLGLKEDLVLKKLLREPSIKWAIRSAARHILD